jgi:hypothetical protein
VLLLPVLLAVPVVLQDNRLAGPLRSWDASSTTTKVLLLVGYFTASWFVAAVLASQWRNIIRLYEGYPLQRLLPSLAASSKRYQLRRYENIERAGRWYELYYDYPEDEREILPTRLGNILRAAERHGYYRFGAETIVLWPRIVHVAPQQFLVDVDDARASLEFLLVLSFLLSTFGLIELPVLLLLGSPSWLVLACFLGGIGGAYAAYISSFGAAREYGEQLRAGTELYRHDVLEKLQVEVPGSVRDERGTWSRVNRFLTRARDDLAWEYSSPGAPELIITVPALTSRRDGARVWNLRRFRPKWPGRGSDAASA